MLINTEAYVLKSRKYNEADSILTLFSKKNGRLSAVAKGSRRAKSQMLAGIQPFCYSNFLLYQGRSMYTVNQVEALNIFYPLREDYKRLTYASYIVELVDIEITEEQTHNQLFTLFGKALTLLSTGNTQVETIMRSFELHFMTVCGYKPNLFRCTHCHSITSDTWYLSLSQGGLVCQQCWSYGTDLLKVSATCLKLARYLQVKEMAEVQQLKIHFRLNEELHRLNTQYLLYHMERFQFKSLAFLPHVEGTMAMPIRRSTKMSTESTMTDGLTDDAEFDTFNKDELKNTGDEQEE